MRRGIRFAIVAAAAVAHVSCGNVVRDGRSPVLLVIDSLGGSPGNNPGTPTNNLLSDVITNITTPEPCTTARPCPTIFNDVGAATLSLAMKNITVAPTSNNQVTIGRYRVEYTRADGRNIQGQDVPYAFDGAVTATVVPGQATTVGFELVRVTAKQETPLRQLVNGSNFLTIIATVTFYGRDTVGNEITASGRMQIDFGNFADR